MASQPVGDPAEDDLLAVAKSMPLERPEWTLALGAQPFLWSVIFCFTCLVIVSFPEYISRRTGMIILFVAAYGAWQTSENLSPDDTFNEIYTRYILIGSSHILSMAYQNDSRKEVPNHLDHKDVKADWNPWYRGWKNLFNIRGVGTPWETPFLWPGIKYTWEAPKPANSSSPTKSADKKDSEKPNARHNLTTRGRWAGVGIRVVYIVINFFLLAACYEFMDEQVLLGTGPADFILEKESILRRVFWTHIGNTPPTTPVKFREVQVRAWQAFECIVGDFLLLSLYHDVCAVVFISLGWDESWEWPPFFGVVTKVWTIRRFWNMFWHRVIYRSFSVHASTFSKALGVSQGTQLARYVNAFLVFWLSAVMHAMVSSHLGNPCAWGRSMLYWMLQPVAFILEAVVQGVWSASGGRKAMRKAVGQGALEWFEMMVGYVWVLCWLLWEAPKRTFPLMNCET
ncbi:hypothetical protein CC80DRAFT_489168 [Byssothecium circinans]|uniref:Wax synthase domain-containing protein n=1 Tax=Byssothecium circinans TaxID=147558 RepID=A0A6A5U8A9_9PLEO|nr:hypothetical protein CC80DRAFT_489168 [Byssothecium circinans]